MTTSQTLVKAPDTHEIEAKSGKVVAAHFGIKETKRVRETVNQLRQQGSLIGSCHEGYFIPSNREEALLAYGFITALFEPLRRAVEGYRGAMEREYGGPSLFDEQDVA